jgi:hypothetical protein
LAVCPFPWTCYLEVVVSAAVAAAFAPRAEVERDAQLVVPPASAPELEQVSPLAAHSVARGAPQVPACPLDDSVAAHSVASLVDPPDALPEQVAPLVVHSVALQAAVRLVASLAGPQGGPLDDYLAVRWEDDHWSPAAVSY